MRLLVGVVCFWAERLDLDIGVDVWEYLRFLLGVRGSSVLSCGLY